MRNPGSGAPLAVALLVIGFAVVPVRPAAGQPGLCRPGDCSVSRVLAQFEEDIRLHGSYRGGYVWALRIMTQQDSFTSAARDSLLAGLEELALGAADPNVRHRASTVLSLAGEPDSGKPLPGIVARLERVYRQTQDDLVRWNIRARAPLQADRRAAAAFLCSLAVAPMPPPRAFDERDAATDALEQLARMGDVGRATLRQLHTGRTVRSEQARAYLEHLAQQGFPVTDIHQARH